MDDDALWASVRTAEMALSSGQYAVAEAEIASVFQALDSENEVSPGLLSNALYVRGLCRTELNQVEGAIADLRAANALDREASSTDNCLMSSEALAAAYDLAGRFAEAERVFRDIVGWAEDAHGSASAVYGRTLVNLGVNLEFQSRAPEAEPLLERAVTLLSGNGPEAPALDSALMTLGTIAFGARRVEEALDRYERALELRRRTLGADHPRTAVVRHNLGLALKALGRDDEALAHVREAVRLRAVLAPDHPWRLASEGLLVQLASQ